MVGDYLGYAPGSGGKHLVCLGKPGLEAQVAVNLTQFVVVDHDQGVDVAAQFLNPALGLFAAHLALELEGDGHDPHREDVELLGLPGDDRGGTGTGAPAHPGGDEDHLGGP